MGGINSTMTNLVFDMVKPQMRSNALAITQSVSGVFGFITTIKISKLVAYIQNNNNVFLGIPIYAQQITSAIAVIFIIAAVLYIKVEIQCNDRILEQKQRS